MLYSYFNNHEKKFRTESQTEIYFILQYYWRGATHWYLQTHNICSTEAGQAETVQSFFNYLLNLGSNENKNSAEPKVINNKIKFVLKITFISMFRFI